MELSILYRGPLASCNYACGYCPFAKHRETPAERAADTGGLERFVRWVEARDAERDRLSVFFTPWGEALTRARYRNAAVRLTRLPHVSKVVFQTNLSTPVGWVAACDASKLALWATFHPSQVTRARFLAQCAALEALGVRYSVGVVGLKEHTAEIEALRAALPPHVYLWVNAYKNVGRYYDAADVRRLVAADPLFLLNTRRYASRGKACRTGHSVIAVDGEGTVRRCHFVPAAIGNLYAPDFKRCLVERPCPRPACACHIGYVHMEDLGLDALFGDGILERIPDPAALAGYVSAMGR